MKRDFALNKISEIAHIIMKRKFETANCFNTGLNLFEKNDQLLISETNQ